MTPPRRPRLMLKPVLTLMAVLMLAAGLSTAQAATPSAVSRSIEPRQPSNKEWPMLSDDDVELIKVFEVDLDGKGRDKPRVTIDKKTIEEFLEKYSENDAKLRGRANQDAFRKADGVEQLRKMFDMRAREFYPKVRIRSQIESLRTWNNLHKREVLGYFRDHFGSGQVKGLLLLPQGRDSNRVAITNFYLMTQTKIDGVPLIDRNNPEESLLVQWGLPREEAKFKAPKVDGWEPRYKDMKDKRFVEVVDWIKSLIRANQDSSYGVNFKLGGKAEAADAPKQN